MWIDIPTAIKNLAKSYGYVYVLNYNETKQKLKEHGIHGEPDHLNKIGVSDTPTRRISGVDSATPLGEVKLRYLVRIFDPYGVESLIHSNFSAKRHPPRLSKPGAGSEEFYRLSKRDLRKLKRLLLMKSFKFELIWNGIPFMLLWVILLIIPTSRQLLADIIRTFW